MMPIKAVVTEGQMLLNSNAISCVVIKEVTITFAMEIGIFFNTCTMAQAHRLWLQKPQIMGNVNILFGCTLLQMKTSQDKIDWKFEIIGHRTTDIGDTPM